MYINILYFIFLQKSILNLIHHFLDGLRGSDNPEDDPASGGAVLETNLRQLLVLCQEHQDGKTFSPEQYAFLHGYLAALLTIKGKYLDISP